MGLLSEFWFPFEREIEDTQCIDIQITSPKGQSAIRNLILPPGKRLRIKVEIEDFPEDE